MNYELLGKINSPEDLKALEENKIESLCTEIRSFLIENVERQGGHLASNLGATELSVAIHRVFDSPKDHVIFDVGHQSYVHKLITGRREAFSTLRKTGGLSGFTKMSESEHDAFGAGHSSTSVSAALGYAEADRLKGNDAYTVAVLGDGAYTGGMVHEALNNCDPDLRLIIILNENGMSISINKGRFASYLSRVRVSKGYRSWKKGTNSFISKLPLIGKPLKRLFTFTKNKIKNLLFSSNYFEDLGLYYMGPFDGNDYKRVEKALKQAKSLNQCVIVHFKTVKGKGYTPAENSPDGFHSVYCKKGESTSFHSVFADGLVSIAESDKDVVAITAAMGIGTGLDRFGKIYPERYYDVGIAEGHALTFSAALAAAGLKPFVAIYSTFLQRGYDSIAHDIALQDLPVRIMIDRAGLAVGDGATHHGIFDVAFLSHIPGITILSPISYPALLKSLEIARDSKHPIAIRYPNCSQSEEVCNLFYPDGKCDSLGLKSTFSCDAAPKKIFITYGGLITRVLDARRIVEERISEPVGILLLETLKPYDELARLVLPFIKNADHVVFAEEGIRNGGAGMLLGDELSGLGLDLSKCKYEIAAIDDNFASPVEACELYDYLGLSPQKLAGMLD